jgi:protein TonB
MPRGKHAAVSSVAGVGTIGYHSPVRLENPPYFYFLVLSLALHVAAVPFLSRNALSPPRFDSIAVSFLPEQNAAEISKAVTPPPLKAERRRTGARPREKTKAPPPPKRVVAPRATELEKRKPDALPAPVPAPQIEPPAPRSEQPLARDNVEQPPQPEPTIESRATPAPEPSIFRQEAPGQAVTRPDLLPNRRDLIGGQRPIPLNTSDARYAPYTQTVKQWIEARWEYPDLAKYYGLQGRVVVEFTILANGQIELLSLVRSSGSKLLDEEAVRAIRAAVPFKPFPRSIQENRLRIIAGFVYADQRLRVSGNR